MNPTQDYASLFRDIFRRLEALETAPRLPNISVAGAGVAFGDLLPNFYERTRDSAYGALHDAFGPVVGPEVTVDVPSGRLILMVGAQVYLNDVPDEELANVSVSAKIVDDTSGLTAVSAGAGSALGLLQFMPNYGAPNSLGVGVVGARLVTGLERGPHTITFQARNQSSGSGSEIMLNPYVFAIPL